MKIRVPDSGSVAYLMRNGFLDCIEAYVGGRKRGHRQPISLPYGSEPQPRHIQLHVELLERR